MKLKDLPYIHQHDNISIFHLLRVVEFFSEYEFRYLPQQQQCRHLHRSLFDQD